MHSFGSDNHSGVHPDVLDAIAEANLGHQSAYGADTSTSKARQLFKESFGSDAEVYFVFNGTAANTLAIRALCRSFEAVVACSTAHVNEDEGGAPEYSTGCKILSQAAEAGKLPISALERLSIEPGNPHRVLPRLLSLTQATECGTVYSLAELKNLTELAHARGLLVHIDGARIANAAAFLGCELADLSTAIGVDALSFGGTKNGLLCAEALVFLRPGLVQDFDRLQKQSMQMASKMRYLSCQFIPYLGEGLWRKNAMHANSMAQLLRQRLSSIPGSNFPYATEANEVFVSLPEPWFSKLMDRAHAYQWDQGLLRLVCSYDTQKTDIDSLFIDLA